MAFSSTSLKTFIARVLITPPSTSLSESVAILRNLQAFGRIAAFAPASQDLQENGQRQEMDVVYSSSDQVLRACNASPLTVEVNHHLPDPTFEDPHNLRGLQSQKQPQPKTFVCHIQRQHDSTYTSQSILSGGFAPSNKSHLYQSLLETNAPPSLVDALGASLSGDGHLDLPDVNVNDVPASTQEEPLDLAVMYRNAVSQHLSPSDTITSALPPSPNRLTRKERMQLRAKYFQSRFGDDVRSKDK